MADFTGVTLSSLASLLVRPIMMTGVFRDHLVKHFATELMIEAPELKRLIWKDDDSTNILIESLYRWDPRVSSRRPAIVIKRNGYKNLRVGIADRNQGPATNRQGHKSYNTFWVGSHTLFCLAGSGRQADYIAAEVQRELTEFGDLLRESLGLQRYQVMEVGEASLLEESTENFVVPVTVGYACQETWVVQQQAPIFKRCSLSFVLDS